MCLTKLIWSLDPNWGKCTEQNEHWCDEVYTSSRSEWSQAGDDQRKWGTQDLGWYWTDENYYKELRASSCVLCEAPGTITVFLHSFTALCKECHLTISMINQCQWFPQFKWILIHKADIRRWTVWEVISSQTDRAFKEWDLWPSPHAPMWSLCYPDRV